MSKRRLLAVIMAAMVTVSTVVTPVSAETMSPDVPSVIDEGTEVYTEEMTSDFTETTVDEEMSSEEEVSESVVTETETTETTSEEYSSEVYMEETVSATEEAETEVMEYVEGTPVTLTAADVTLSGGTITKYIGTYADYTDIIIPSEIGGVTITAIGNRAFYGKKIGSVTFPETLETIDMNSFEGAALGSTTKLGKVVIPGSVTYIGYDAFRGCEYLGSVEFEDAQIPASDGITFSLYAERACVFRKCPRLTKITLSNNFVTVPAGFAEECTALQTVEWGPNIRTIGAYAFNKDAELQEADLTGTKLEVIRTGAFEGCAKLHNVKFPEGLTVIGNSAFEGAGLGTKVATESLFIPGTVTSIEYDAFRGCQYLGSVSFEDVETPALEGIAFSLYAERARVFSKCPRLTKITLSNNFVTVPAGFAEECTALQTVEWGPNIGTIGAYAFNKDAELQEADLTGTKLEVIKTGAFKACAKLHNVKLPEGLTVIGDSVFEGAGLGTKTEAGALVIPKTVDYIGYSAFKNCSYLGSVEFEDADIPTLDGIEFGLYAEASTLFRECPKLSSIRFSNNVKKLPKAMATYCPVLTSIYIPTNVEEIASGAFYVNTRDKLPTVVAGGCDAVKKYDWEKDNRLLTRSYSIIFHSNDGVDKTVTQPASVGYDINLLANTFKYTGYKFSGWNTKQDGTGVQYANGAVVKNLAPADGSIDLYAQWTPRTYNVVLNADGGLIGKNATKTISVVFNKTYAAVDEYTPVRKGFVFRGWFTEPEGAGGSHTWASESVTATPFATLYAKWEPVKYAIYFDGNAEDAVAGRMVTGKGVSVSPSVGRVYNVDGEYISDTDDDTYGIAVEYGEYIKLTGGEYVRTGYALTGWNTLANGKGKAYANIDIMPLSEKNITLYAQWKPVNYSITYNLDGGKNNKNNPKKYNIKSPEIQLKDPTKQGFTFAGWKVGGYTVTKIPAGSNGNIVLTAEWTENKYTINYHGASDYTSVEEPYSVADITYTEAVDMIAAADIFTVADEYKDVKSIVAWTTKANGKGTRYDLKKVYSKLAKVDGTVIDLYAVWGTASYPIEYTLNGGTNNKKNPFYYTYSKDKIVAIKAPARPGYIFDGWEVSGTGAEFFAVNKLNKGARGGVVLSATWKPVEYTVVLNKNNAKAVVTEAATVRYSGIKYNDAYDSFKSSDIVTNEWYELTGWNTKANGKGIAATMDGDGNVCLAGLSKSNGAIVKLYAQWQVHTYNITYVNISPRMAYDSDNSYETQLKGVVNKNAKVYKQSALTRLSNPTCAGYVFQGWYTDEECTNRVTAIAKGTSGDITLYSKWRKK